MKTSKAALESLNAKLAHENEALALALSDICADRVKWFGRAPAYSLGISRPAGAAGGIVIVRQNGMTYAHYWERYYAESMSIIASLVTGSDTEHNRELLNRRAVLEAAKAHVTREQHGIPA